jgi:hypothetical protein
LSSNTLTALPGEPRHPFPPPANRHDIVLDSPSKPSSPATVAIASISDQDWYISRTHGVYHIPACPKGEPYALLLLSARPDALDLGDNRRFPFVISAREIADDLLQDLQDHGIFVCAGPRPTKEELAEAAARRDGFYFRLVTEADVMWARGHSYREISDLHRRAAIALGMEREWAYVPIRMVDCPACGEKVKPGVAVCKHCHAILDTAKAAQHGLAGRGASANAVAHSSSTGSPIAATQADPLAPSREIMSK